ncbi:MAG: hypothetical protein E4H01_13640 [Lysobacterales bacterium]|nr:MAG: hypothetical protein E4H01_13640 [Xanthomonadales bacterium]
MAYATSNPPRVIADSVGATGGALWMYVSADAAATVLGAGYITNGADLGMKVNDAILIVDSATPLATLAMVDAVAAGGAAELT